MLGKWAGRWVATAFDVRRSRGGKLYDRESRRRAAHWSEREGIHNTEAGKADSVHEGAAAPSQHHELFPTHTGVMRCLAQPLRGSTTQRKHFSTNTPKQA